MSSGSQSVVYCNGNGVTGPDRLAFWFSELLIVATFIYFWIFICKPLITHHSWGPVCLFASFFLIISIIATHALASLTDPGIIPRKKGVVTPMEEEKQEVLPDGTVVTTTFCYTCRIWKFPGTHHCSTCNNCVLEFDHHCPWVGNCIGKRNYRWFNLFLYSLIFSCFYVEGITGLGAALTIFNSTETVRELLPHLAYHIAIGIWCLMVILTIGGLCGFHCYLICVGKSTYEELRKHSHRSKPHMRGCADVPGNFHAIFVDKQPDSQFDRHASSDWSSDIGKGENALLLGQILSVDSRGQLEERRDSFEQERHSFETSNAFNTTSAERTGVAEDDGVAIPFGPANIQDERSKGLLEKEEI